MTKLTFIISLILLTVLTACNTVGNKERVILTNITGEPNEVLVVMNKTSWNSEAGKTLKNCLEDAYYGLPQYQAALKAIQIDQSGFTNMFQLYRNIIDVNISTKVKKNKIWFGNDVYARPQSYLKIDAINGIEFSKLINNNTDKILEFFKNAEIERLQKAYTNHFSVDIMKLLREKYQIKVDIPSNYRVSKDSTNFTWISYETPDMSQGIFVYSYPYQDTAQFNQVNLIKQRDKFLKKFVDGPTKGSYMQTEHEYPVRRTAKFTSNNLYFVFLQGLWRVEGDFMGGPFVSYSFPDKENERIICLDAYVYCPKKDKRDFIMQMEAIIKTARYN